MKQSHGSRHTLYHARCNRHPPYVQGSFVSAALTCKRFQQTMCWHYCRSGSQAAAARSRGKRACSGIKAAGHAAQLSGHLRASWQPVDRGAPAGHRCRQPGAGLFWSPGALQGPACLAAPAGCSRGDHEPLLRCYIHEINLHESPCLPLMRRLFPEFCRCCGSMLCFCISLGYPVHRFHTLPVALLPQ